MTSPTRRRGAPTAPPVEPSMLDERRRLGLDGRDEMWDGVVHVVPPAGDAQQEVQAELFPVLAALAKQRGLVPRFETGLRWAGGLPGSGSAVLPARPALRTRSRGAELVVEVRSTGDEIYEKIDWYAAHGVHELLIVHPDGRRFELLRRVGSRLLPVSPDAVGASVSEVLGVALSTVNERLTLTWRDGSAEI